MRRIFIGIPASKELQSKAEKFFLPRQALPVRRIKPQNLHITLAPPWSIDNEAWSIKHKALQNQLQTVANQFKPFEIRFESISFGPDEKNPKLIWAIGRPSKEAVSLQKKVEKSIYSLTHGRELKNRSFTRHLFFSDKISAGFKLHMTLARIKQPFPPSLFKFRGAEIDWEMNVDRFVLYESRLKPEGAEYEVIEELSLQEILNPIRDFFRVPEQHPRREKISRAGRQPRQLV